MDELHIHISILLTNIVTVSFLLLTTLPQFHCQPPPPGNNYSFCKEEPYRYNCGKLSNISYPFWGQNRPSYCGGGDPFYLYCHQQDDDIDTSTTTIQIGSQNFTVLGINTTTHSMRIVRTDLFNGVCSPQFGDTYWSPTLFKYPDSVYNITISYDCSQSRVDSAFPYNFTCGHQSVTYHLGNPNSNLPPPECERHVRVPVDARLDHARGGLDGLQEVLEKGFEVKYIVAPECVSCLGSESEGNCWTTDFDKHISSCYYCPDGSHALHCKKNKWNWKRKLAIGVASAVIGALVVIAALFFYRRRKNNYSISYMQSRSLSSDPSSKDPEKGSQHFGVGVHLFTYTELEVATNYFDPSKELGEGGFGTVYYGKLRDGRGVAVKRLYENNYRRVEQFMNEVGILTRLVHPNLVSLYGCTSRHSRELLLVYEYVPNGTVADHLHGKQAKPGKLPWHIRMNIAVETASALKYLHISDIIHRDIKTNNILLDNHFRVKVADFGLSRLFPDHVTHVSTAPQGTPGYVDPEYHECYQLTSKSDVYSFGVVLIELISSLPAVDITRHRHEINLANMAINKIQNQALHELVDKSLGFDSDFKVRKMINAVAELAFQCLQSSKDMRPSMDEVLDTLKDIQSDGKYKSQPEVMDITSSADDVVLLKDDPPPPSPDSNVISKSTTPNASG